jgi:hypothetical protein
LQALESFVHVLTHKDLHIHPLLVRFSASRRLPSLDGGWVGNTDWPTLGLPAPVRLLPLGEVPMDAAVRESVQRRRLLMDVLPGSPAAVALAAAAARMLPP